MFVLSVIFNLVIPLFLNEELPISITLFGIITSNAPEHLKNMFSGIFSIPSSNTTFFKFVHPVNGPASEYGKIVSILFGISISSNPVQLPIAYCPNLVMFCNFRLVISECPLNALPPIVVTYTVVPSASVCFFGTTISAFVFPFSPVMVVPSVLHLK